MKITRHSSIEDRNAYFLVMMSRYNITGVLDPPVPPDKMELMRRSLIVSHEVYAMLKKTRPDLIHYLLPWTMNSEYRYERDSVVVYFPLLEGKKYEMTEEHRLDWKVMGCFWYCNLYTLNPDYDKFRKLESIGYCNFEFSLPPSRNMLSDGQLKITLDAMLAVDALPKKDKLKIIVIGCASPMGVLSGCAYEVLSLMVTNSVFHMYDPFTVNTRYKLGTNQFIHYAQKVKYSDFSSFDLVLDDAWVEGQSHKEFDPNGFAYSGRNYSVKRFPWMQEDIGNVYHQVFRTDRNEQRTVSRDITSYKFRSLPVGICPGCLELKYLLKDEYLPEVFDRFMAIHQKNCLDGSFRTIDEQRRLLHQYKYYTEEVPKCYKMVWDIDLAEDLPIMPLDLKTIQACNLMISSVKVLTSYVLNNAKLILMLNEDGTFTRITSKKDKKIEDVPKAFKIQKHDPISTYAVDHIASEGLEPQETYAYSFKVYGKVIGVSFRNSVAMYAIQQGFKVKIENKKDHVSGFVIATGIQLSTFFYWLMFGGPPGAFVQDYSLEREDIVSYEDYIDFNEIPVIL